MRQTRIDKANLHSTLVIGLLLTLLFQNSLSQTSSTASPTSSTASPTSASPSSASNAQCKVDQCAVCPDTTNILCTTCRSGYYLRTFTGGDKTYNACWSIAKLILSLLGLLLLSYCCCGLCYLCYKLGLQSNVRRARGYAPPKYYRRPVVAQPQPVVVARPAPVVQPRVVRPRPIARPVVQPRVVSPRVATPRVVSPRVVSPRAVTPRVVSPRVASPARVRQPAYSYV
jgi:hypothetical protein